MAKQQDKKKSEVKPQPSAPKVAAPAPAPVAKKVEAPVEKKLPLKCPNCGVTSDGHELSFEGKSEHHGKYCSACFVTWVARYVPKLVPNI